MIYLLLVLLILLFFISYYLTGRDFFAPSTMMVLTFAFATLFAAYILSDLNYDLHGETVWIIISCLFISVVVNVTVHHMFLRVKVLPKHENATPIPKGFHSVMFALVLFVAISMIVRVISVSGISGSIAQLMVVYRQTTYSGSDESQLSVGMRILTNTLQILAVVYAYSFFRFRKQLSCGQKVIHCGIMLLCVLASLVTASRFWAFSFIISTIVLYHLTRIQENGGYRKYRLKFLIKIGVVILVAAWFFFAIRNLVGRNDQSTLMDYTADYIGSGIINLDLYLNDPVPHSTVFGQETFHSLNNTLRRVGLLKIDFQTIHKEFRTLLGKQTGNVYTTFRAYHRDFGICGVFVLHFIFSVFYSYLYEFVKKRKDTIIILIFSSIYYPLMTIWYADYFFSSVVRLGTFLSFPLFAFFYYLLLRKDKVIRLTAR